MLHPRERGRARPLASVSRREFLRRIGLGTASLPLASGMLAACGRPQPEVPESVDQPARPEHPVTLPLNEDLMIPDGMKPESGPLEVYNWEEYINPRVVGMFEDQYGVKVNVNTFNTMAEAVATITSTEQNYDVWIADIDQLGKVAASGLLRPLNKTYLPNLDNVWEVYRGTKHGTPYYDAGAQYSVPYTTYTTGVGWRVDRGGPSEDDVVGLDNPWNILWDKRWRGKIHILDDYREAIGMALLRNGVTDINTDDASTRAANLQAAGDALIQLVHDVNVRADISDYTDLPEGQSLVHHGWSGDFIAAKWYFPKDQVDRDVIRYWTPDAGGPGGNDTLTIMAGGKHPVLAHAFLNFMLEWENAMVNFQWNGYIPPQTRLDPKDLITGAGYSWSIVLPHLLSTITTEESLAKATELAPLTPGVDSMWQETWERFQTAG